MTATTVVSNRYALHGVSIMTHADDDVLLHAAHRMLAPFFDPLSTGALAAQGGQASPDFRIELSTSTPPRPRPADARVWMDWAPLRCYTDEQDAYLELDGTYVARLDASAGRIQVWIPAGLRDNHWLVGHAILLPLLFEALRTRGLFTLHAAALARHDRVVIFPAESGSGKTTLALALLRADFHLLSDDSPFLRRMDGQIRLHAFPERVNVTARTCAFFPELLPHWDAPRADSRGKVPIDTAAVYGRCSASEGTPSAVIFPAIGAVEQTIVKPLAKSEALLRLMPMAGPTASRQTAAAQFSIIADLVANTPCYEMRTGRDFQDIPRLICRLLDTPEE